MPEAPGGQSLRVSVPIRLACAAVCICLLGGGAESRAELQRSDPLVVPDAPLPAPEEFADQPVEARIEVAAQTLREHGFEELPILAWALLEEGRDAGDAALMRRAVDLAPGTPGVRFEAARLLRSPGDLIAALTALGTSFPGLLWLAQMLGAALGIALLCLAAVLVIVTALRSAPLHAHAIGHLGNSKDAPGLPGIVATVALLGFLPLIGAGPALVLAMLGALAALRGSKRQAVGVFVALLFAGVCLGPGIDAWTRVVAIQGADSHLLSAWRVDRAQPLPGDLERLEAAAARHPDDVMMRLALATAWKRQGDLARAETALGDRAPRADATLRASIHNLRGIIALARGRAQESIREFESARSAHESAAVLFNLSQAYGRALMLLEQKPVFNAARSLDRELVAHYTSLDGRTIHDHVIHAPLPLWIYARQAIAPDPGSKALAQELRSMTLGAGLPGWTWLALPVLGLLGVALRRGNVQACSRCGRAICEDCNPELAGKEACVRCNALFSRSSISDPRVHGEQLVRERKRQRRMARALAWAGLVVPGSAHLYRGQWRAGVVRVVALAVGCFFVLGADALPVPWEVGALAHALPFTLGFLLLAPLFLTAVLGAVREVREARALR